MTAVPPLSALDTCAIVVAAGTGQRSGSAIPKQLCRLNGVPMLRWSVETLRRHPRVGRIVVVHTPSLLQAFQDALSGVEGVMFVEGGATRRASVHAGLKALNDAVCPHVLVHDAARPGITRDVIDRVLEALQGAAGAIPTLPMADTVMHAETADIVDRSALARVQTPQGFRLGELIGAHTAWPDIDEPTDDAQMLRAAGHRVVTVPGDERLHKVTLPEDFSLVQHWLGTEMMRVAVGSGYDVHRLVPGDGVWLCGVRIPHTAALSGHSDADVALHAVTDALFGAMADGDIGSHFPPSDAQWKGASSDRFLAHAVQRLRDRGGVIDHLDVTVICEAPKVGPHRDAMRDSLARIAGVPLDRISVKATTTERLGFTGRNEGIAAMASATVRLPVSEEMVN